MSKKTESVGMPIKACWLLTSRCNYSCQFCHRVLDKRELYYNEAIVVADKLIQAGIQKISFSGGEPMLWTGIYDLLKYVKERGVVTMMITNGALLNKDSLYEYSKVLDWITLPIDGSTEDMQTKMTRSPGHLGRIIEFLDFIEEHKLNLKVKINTVYGRPNANDLVDIAKLVNKHPAIKRWKIFQFYPIRGLALRFQKKFLVSENKFSSVQNKVLTSFKNWKGKSVYFASNQDLERSYFTLAPDGTVFLSYNNKDYHMGDLTRETVKEIWMNNLYDKTAHGEQADWMSSERKGVKQQVIRRLKRKSGAMDGGII